MKDINARSLSPLVVAAAMAAGAPAWSQDAGVPSAGNDAVMQRLDALVRELEQLKVQVKANEERAIKAEQAVAAAQQQPPKPPVEKTATEGLSRQATSEVAGGDDEGIVIVKTPKASLRFYGMVDVGLEALNGRLAAGVDDNSLRVSNGMITPHFGVIGNGNLVDGLQGSFNLEGSFAPDNGTSGIGGRLFGRQAWVGLSGNFGTVRLGRQYTMVRMGWEDANPYGTGNQGLRLLDPRISNPRADNSISYFRKFGPVTAGVNLSSGWDAVNGNAANTGPATTAGANCAGEVPTDEQQCHEHSVGVKYDGGSWAVTGSFERLWGGTSATFGGLTSRSKSDTRYVLGGYVNLSGGIKLTAGWVNRQNEGSSTPKSDMYWMQGVFPLGGKYFVDALVGELKYRSSVNKALLLNARARYVLDKDTTLYVTAASLDNGGTLALPSTASTPAPTPKAGATQTSVITGILYKF